MNIITVVFMLGVFGMPVLVECAALSAASAPLLGVQNGDAEDFVGLPYDHGADYVPPLPLQEMQSPSRSSLGTSSEVSPVATTPLTPEVRTKKFILSVLGNDDAAFTSLFRGDSKVLHQLAQQRFSIPKFENITPIHVASKNGNLHMVKALREQGGADVMTPLKGGFTPLISASKEGHADVVDYLASLPVQQDYSNSLSEAIKAGHKPVVETLMKRVVYNLHDFDHAIALARHLGREDIAQYVEAKKKESLQKEIAARDRQHLRVLQQSQVSDKLRHANVEKRLGDVNGRSLVESAVHDAKF